MNDVSVIFWTFFKSLLLFGYMKTFMALPCARG